MTSAPAKFYGKLFTDQLRARPGHGHRAGVPVRDELVDYSRFVGDIFGAPLAIEALLAFFLESTFLGLWIFGWDRLPEKLHAACMWIGRTSAPLLSAYFILAANSFMQNPVGYRYNPTAGRAELTDFGAVLSNKVAAGDVPARHRRGIPGRWRRRHGASRLWHLRRATAAATPPMYRAPTRLGAVVDTRRRPGASPSAATSRARS